MEQKGCKLLNIIIPTDRNSCRSPWFGESLPLPIWFWSETVSMNSQSSIVINSSSLIKILLTFYCLSAGFNRTKYETWISLVRNEQLIPIFGVFLHFSYLIRIDESLFILFRFFDCVNLLFKLTNTHAVSSLISKNFNYYFLIKNFRNTSRSHEL